MSSFYCNCLVCDVIVESFKIVDDPYEVEKLLGLFWVFCGHMKVDHSLTEHFDFETEPFPFCKPCTCDLIQLSKCHRKSSVSSSQRQNISKFVARLSFKILNSFGDKNHVTIKVEPGLVTFNNVEGPTIKRNNGQEDVDPLTSIKSNVFNIRESIFNAYNVKVVVDKIDPEVDKDRLLLQLKSSRQEDAVKEDDDDDVNLDDDDSFDEDDESNESQDEETVVSKLFPSEENDDSDRSSVQVIERSRSPKKPKNHWSDTKTVKVGKNKFRHGDEFYFEEFGTTFKCSTCDYSSTVKGCILRHIQVVHYASYRFKCKICRRRFQNRSHCEKHEASKEAHLIPTKPANLNVFREITGPDSSDPVRKFLYRNLYPFELVDQVFKCGSCSYTSTNKNLFLGHIRDVHINKGRYPCPMCPKSFNRSFDLRSHIETHSTDKKYTCSHCGMALKSPKSLKYHELTHQRVKLGQNLCDQCGKSFARPKLLSAHIKIKHTNERPFKCSVCFKGFAIERSLKRHNLLHLKVMPFLCHLCGEGYKDNADVLRHVKRAHDPSKPVTRKRKRRRYKVHDLHSTKDIESTEMVENTGEKMNH